MEHGASGTEIAVLPGSGSPLPGGVPPDGPPRPPSRVDVSGETAALAYIRDGQREPAFRILMEAYGAPLTSFAVRVLRDRVLAEDIRQQVFLEALQGIDRFRGSSSLWSWLCGIAYHRCLDELKRSRRARPENADLLDTLAGEPDAMMDDDRVAKRQALERCLGKFPAPIRAQLLMRYFLDLSYQEIGDLVGDAHGTVQVRMSRILPRLRHCLRDKGMDR